MIDSQPLRRLIREKLADGRLPQNGISRVSGGAGNNEMCVACDEPIATSQLTIDGIDEAMKAVQFHIRCFYYWDAERTPPEGSTAAGDGSPE